MAITRFAPSPTGYLHIGGLRTSLYNYLWARKTNGEFRLRIEDTDTARNNEEAMKAIISAFDWVGLNYDGEVLYQSQRTDIYKIYIDKLLENGDLYFGESPDFKNVPREKIRPDSLKLIIPSNIIKTFRPFSFT